MNFVVSNFVVVPVNRITLSIGVRVHDWTAELAIIACNDVGKRVRVKR